MNAIEFLEKMLYEGWDNRDVVAYHPSRNEKTAKDLAVNVFGLTIDEIDGAYRVNSEATYCAVHRPMDDCWVDVDDFYKKSVFKGSNGTYVLYFFELV